MANYSVLKAAVQAVVKTNGNQEITGANMQSTLISIINSLGTGYQFMGVATPSTNPGTPDQREFYITGEAGAYTNFNSLVVTGIAVLYYDTAWHVTNVAPIDEIPTASSNNLVKSGGVAPLEKCLVGKGNTIYRLEIPLIPNHQYKMSLKNPNWDITGVTVTGVSKFGIYFSYNGADTRFVEVSITNTVDAEYTFTVPSNCDNVAFQCRATTGEKIYFSVVDITITENVVKVNETLNKLDYQMNGYLYEGAFTITSTGTHSSNNDRIYFDVPVPAGEFFFKVESGTTGNEGAAQFYVKYVGESSNTNIGTSIINTGITATLIKPIESIGIYMAAQYNQNTGTMPLTIQSISQGVYKDTAENRLYQLNNRFIGDDANFASVDVYGLKAGVRYRIELQDPSLLTDTTTSTDVTKFTVQYQNGAQTFGGIISVRIGGGAVANYYDFTIPNDLYENGAVKIGGRAVKGKVINFSIYNVWNFEYITYGFARCSVAANVANKTVTLSNFATANNERVRFMVYMSNPTTVDSFLVVNGASPLPLFYNGARASANNSWAANEYLDITYNQNYPAFWATTRTTLSQNVNTNSPSTQKVISEKGIIDFVNGNTERGVAFYNEDKTSAITSAASRSPLRYGYVNNELCPAFTILTDLHSDLTRFNRACAFTDSISELLGTFCLGDLIDTSNSANPYPLVLNYTKPIISITGNHEVLKISSQGITGWSESDIIGNIYNPDMVAHNGETHPSGKCYWYKDYSKIIDGTTNKLRVIGLHQYESNGTGEQNSGSGKDVCYYTQDQIDWLINTLDSVDSNTWVMLLIHYAPTSNMTRVECPFTPSASFNFPLQGGSNTGGSSSMSDDEFIPKIIQAWIDGTTLNASCDITLGETVTHLTAIKATAFASHPQKFTGYFCGHTHRDFVGKLTNYPKQMSFAFICTTASTAQNACDIGRNTTGRSQDCFTCVGIDWFQNSVSLIRVGADVTTDMRDRKWFNISIPV